MLVFILLFTLIPIVVTLGHLVLIKTLVKLIKNEKLVGFLTESYIKSNRSKWLNCLFLFSLLIFGMSQVIKYYLLGGNVLFIIFSCGLILPLYIAPLFAFVLPCLKIDNRSWGKSENFGWNFVAVTTWWWGLALILDKSTKIYSDATGSSYITGNGTLKLLGGISLIVVAIYVTLAIMIKYMHERKFQ